ncbi:probable antibacterial peptide polyprotein isoform X29 [Oncorhynchus keta]|uniref:probable antibacterial peptide polyprotein isoform X28 n=1 Tax=Oncorhynchus keta TaxID=8018 RepID=UPI00227AF42C|nr:probable antibacterial peptide polyprotein isoform X28 [Oncorhynchus keta]XP_052330277.1 probable antibacterial peptide polyprotein isoform X29 [Oncorhynchus keta]
MAPHCVVTYPHRLGGSPSGSPGSSCRGRCCYLPSPPGGQPVRKSRIQKSTIMAPHCVVTYPQHLGGGPSGSPGSSCRGRCCYLPSPPGGRPIRKSRIMAPHCVVTYPHHLGGGPSGSPGSSCRGRCCYLPSPPGGRPIRKSRIQLQREVLLPTLTTWGAAHQEVQDHGTTLYCYLPSPPGVAAHQEVQDPVAEGGVVTYPHHLGGGPSGSPGSSCRGRCCYLPSPPGGRPIRKSRIQLQREVLLPTLTTWGGGPSGSPGSSCRGRCCYLPSPPGGRPIRKSRIQLQREVLLPTLTTWGAAHQEVQDPVAEGGVVTYPHHLGGGPSGSPGSSCRGRCCYLPSPPGGRPIRKSRIQLQREVLLPTLTTWGEAHQEVQDPVAEGGVVTYPHHLGGGPSGSPGSWHHTVLLPTLTTWGAAHQEVQDHGTTLYCYLPSPPGGRPIRKSRIQLQREVLLPTLTTWGAAHQEVQDPVAEGGVVTYPHHLGGGPSGSPGSSCRGRCCYLPSPPGGRPIRKSRIQLQREVLLPTLTTWGGRPIRKSRIQLQREVLLPTLTTWGEAHQEVQDPVAEGGVVTYPHHLGGGPDSTVLKSPHCCSTKLETFQLAWRDSTVSKSPHCCSTKLEVF